MNGIIKLDSPQACGCYLEDPINPKHLCAQPAHYALNYAGIVIPVCRYCAQDLRIAYDAAEVPDANRARRTMRLPAWILDTVGEQP